MIKRRRRNSQGFGYGFLTFRNSSGTVFITRLVFTNSAGTVFNPANTFTDSDSNIFTVFN